MLDRQNVGMRLRNVGPIVVGGFTAAIGLLVPAMAGADDVPGSSQSRVVQREGPRGEAMTVVATRLDTPLRVDGRLDERPYAAVDSLATFTQIDPNNGAPASERTEAWVFFDDEAIYIAGR